MAGAGVTPLLITVSEAKDVPFRADPFVVIEAGGARTQTDVLRDTIAPVWDQMFTLRAVFTAGTREEAFAGLQAPPRRARTHARTVARTRNNQ